MQKRDLFAIGIVMLCTAVAVGYHMFNKPHEGTRNIAPASQMGALDLYTAYQRDEKGSDAKFLGKVIEVSGHIAEVSINDSTGNMVLASGEAGGVNCSFGTETLAGLKNIHPGDSVSVKGRCTGFLMDVNLSDCVLAP